MLNFKRYSLFWLWYLIQPRLIYKAADAAKLFGIAWILGMWILFLFVVQWSESAQIDHKDRQISNHRCCSEEIPKVRLRKLAHYLGVVALQFCSNPGFFPAISDEVILYFF